jgi:ubiquinone biosynthesis monooxygenase Coq6
VACGASFQRTFAPHTSFGIPRPRSRSVRKLISTQIGADGPNSPVRKYAGIDTYGWVYDTHAIVGTLQHAPRVPPAGANTVAYQRFLPTGPIAFLPLTPTVSSLVWSTTPALAAAIKACEPAVLARMVNAAFRLPAPSMNYLHARLLEAHSAGVPLSASAISEEILFRERSHGILPTSAFASLASPSQGIAPQHAETIPPLVASIQDGSVASFPLRYSHADSYLGARTVLIGDAAHTIHPLAGQGLNLGLADAAALAQCLESAVRTGGDIGGLTALQPYARARYTANHAVMAAVDKLHRLYGTETAPVVWARSVGLEVVNELDSLKTALMLSAGARSRSRMQRAGSPVWGAVAGGIQNVSELSTTAKMVGGVVQGLVGAGLQNLGQRISGR